jgi:hypothetical protein
MARDAGGDQGVRRVLDVVPRYKDSDSPGDQHQDKLTGNRHRSAAVMPIRMPKTTPDTSAPVYLVYIIIRQYYDEQVYDTFSLLRPV